MRPTKYKEGERVKGEEGEFSKVKPTAAVLKRVNTTGEKVRGMDKE